ncbi:MAG: hypothetical protein L6Q92_13950 [Phycisphaerae bacterium]|nr:hypothetical protein [Phycisphaerae bacterium]
MQFAIPSLVFRPFSLCLLLTAALGAVAGAVPSTDNRVTSAPAASKSNPMADRLEPVALPDGSADEAKLRTYLARRLAALRESADRATDGNAVAAALTATEFILVRQVEPALSRELLGLASTEDRRAIAEWARTAKSLLNAARKRMNGAALEESGWTDRLANAEAFAELFMQLGSDADETSRAEALTHACRELAPLLDSTQPELAASARLWQAAAYRRAGRADRAMQVLPHTTITPKELPHDFFSRLERCRALGDQRQFTPAVALLIRLEAQIDSWIPADGQSAARHAAMLTREQLQRSWADALEHGGNSDAAAKVRRDAEATRRQIDELSCGLYRLGAAIGGIDAPLVPPRRIAQWFDVRCDEPRIAIVLDLSATRAATWETARTAIDAFLGTLNPDQSFAIVVAATDVETFPTESLASPSADDIRAATRFLHAARSGEPAGTRVTDALLRGLSLKPNVILLVASTGLERSFTPEVVRRMNEDKVKLHVLWLGDDSASSDAQNLARSSGGEFRALSGSSTTREATDPASSDATSNANPDKAKTNSSATATQPEYGDSADDEDEPASAREKPSARPPATRSVDPLDDPR